MTEPLTARQFDAMFSQRGRRIIWTLPAIGRRIGVGADFLFAIGFAADRAIEQETARLVSDFAAKTRADALAKVHAALPHIFGRAA
jgi:hypothetical protein